ncbi:YicC/YloC family endoribonuclease [Alcanivorax sp. DP30]|uniref:YicC/YloC family endoribonuclease n=1 Tax=Alcanivorax sp. DP30 TaxID=2606217 RepID=UPI001367AD4D|nr:YicC/YloC family endoribonuclease [Alcanivorax sp. DP30]MZR62894.1 YicC family protein [Alcanivorax sp. DP30]
MICSMTAFARADRHLEGFSLAWEIKSVNHRYLEISPRLPDTLRAVENGAREKCRQALARGKVEITLRYQQIDSDVELELNEELVKKLSDVSRRVGDLVQHSGQVNPMEVLRYPGVLSTQELDVELLQKEALSLLDDALKALIDTRAREGEQLGKMITERLDGIEKQVEIVKAAIPRIKEAQRERLRKRIQDVVESPDPDRLEQELVMLAQKMDVDEELDRLVTHVSEVRRIVKKGGHIGRRLDFLMQELNREANTLGSKSVDSETTAAAVELKVLIEQMREQIQNIE